jgi:hypothetical protein
MMIVALSLSLSFEKNINQTGQGFTELVQRNTGFLSFLKRNVFWFEWFSDRWFYIEIRNDHWKCEFQISRSLKVWIPMQNQRLKNHLN